MVTIGVFCCLFNIYFINNILRFVDFIGEKQSIHQYHGGKLAENSKVKKDFSKLVIKKEKFK